MTSQSVNMPHIESIIAGDMIDKLGLAIIDYGLRRNGVSFERKLSDSRGINLETFLHKDIQDAPINYSFYHYT